MAFVIAIDGPAGSGKGTVAKQISETLGFVNIDTGAMYRCVALKALREHIQWDEIKKIAHMMEHLNIEIKREGTNQIIYLDGENVSEEIREPEVDDTVAKYAKIACVREKMTPLQRKMGEHQNIVMEGRDIGTVVFPDANLKVYIDATTEERAKRRYKQNQEKGIQISYEEVLDSIIQRHKLETQRQIAPLKQAEDAIYIDTTNKPIEEVVEEVLQLIKEKQEKEKK